MTTEEQPPSKQEPSRDGDLSSRGGKLAVFGILLLAFLLRGWNLHEQGFTADEVAELVKAHAPLPSILLDQDDDRFPPLYRLVLGLWIRAWDTDLASRWLNVLCGVLAVGVAWRAGVELLGSPEGLWPALLLACCPFHIHYCREGRAYALYFLFCAIAIWALLRLARDRRWGNWTLLGLSSLAAIYTHYYAVPLLIAIWTMALVEAYRSKKLWRGIAAAATVSLATLPAAYLLWRALQDLPAGKLVATFDFGAWGYTYMSLVTGFTLGPSMRELRAVSTAEGIQQFLPWIILVGLILLLLSYHSLVRLRDRKIIVGLAVLLLALIPIIGCAGNLTGVGFVYRYVSWLAFPFVLWLGAGAARCFLSRGALLATLALLLLNATALANRYYNVRYQGEDFRAVAQYLEKTISEPRPILVASPYMAQALNYYLDDRWQVSSFPIFPQLQEQREADIAKFQSLLPRGTSYWFVSQWLPVADPRRQTRDRQRQSLGVEFLDEISMMEIYMGAR